MTVKIPPRTKDLTSQKFNMLTVKEYAGVTEGKARMSKWLCECDCGAMTIVIGSHLKSGSVKSCGCNRGREKKHGMHNTPTYISWKSMKARCSNPKSPDYKNYGARGITYCVEWEEFDQFLADMGVRPLGRTLDRIDTDGNYSKENCKWSTAKEQANNRRGRKKCH